MEIIHDPSRAALFGDAFEPIIKSFVRKLRRSLALAPTPAARYIHDALQHEPLFAAARDEVAPEKSPPVGTFHEPLTLFRSGGVKISA